MPPSKSEHIEIKPVEMAAVNAYIIGTTGLYINRMSAKAKRQLLIGGRKKTAAERTQLKHDPRAEYRDAMYVDEGWHPHSNVRFPAMALKGALSTAALATPGIRKTDVARLVRIVGEHVPIFGIPKLKMSIMRSADVNRTPDIRTRPWFEHWATEFEIHYVKGVFSKPSIFHLLTNAGVVAGIGDGRQEKGKGDAGAFKVALGGHADFPAELLDRDAQWAAINNPVPADQETADLLMEIDNEVESRNL